MYCLPILELFYTVNFTSTGNYYQNQIFNRLSFTKMMLQDILLNYPIILNIYIVHYA